MLYLGASVLRVEGTHWDRHADRAGSQTAHGLHAVLPICIGARVMLTNLWTDKRLVNGSVGTAEDIAWDWSHGGSHHRRPPAVL
ncbi:hypothetical protein E4U10_003956, partial [Claviceps purpurea]